MSKLLFYDLETTGPNYWQHSIHQLSAIAVIEDKIVDKLNLFIRPHEKALIDPIALKASNVTVETINAYPHRTEQFDKLIEFIKRYIDPFNPEDKFYLVGFNNMAFDDKFLRQFWALENDQGFGLWFWPNSIDLMSMASYYLMPDRHRMPSFKLFRVCKWVGIDVDESRLHDGAYDCEIAYQLYEKIKGKTIDDF